MNPVGRGKTGGEFKNQVKNRENEPVMMTHNYNPSTQKLRKVDYHEFEDSQS